LRCSYPVARSLRRKRSQPAKQNKAGGKPILTLDGGVPYFKVWLQQDVVWIITNEERAAFKLLQNDEERDNFIEAFWTRRNPTPDSFDNAFKDEHYRRIVYANEHFGASVPGWKSDRGRIYIVYGPPDSIDPPSSYRAEDKKPEGGGDSLYSLEVWRYRYLEGVGQDVAIEFVDVCRCGDYQMRLPPELKDALLYIPGSAVGARGGREEPGGPQVFVGRGRSPKVKFKGLEEKAIVGLKGEGLPFEVDTDTVKATDVTSLVPITINFQRRDITFVEKGGSLQATLNIFGRVTTLTGRVAEIFEGTLEIEAASESEASSKDATSFAKTLALRNGHYRVEIAAQEVGNDHWGRWVRGVKVGE
jgi:GWxTD domain-containing protein